MLLSLQRCAGRCGFNAIGHDEATLAPPGPPLRGSAGGVVAGGDFEAGLANLEVLAESHHGDDARGAI
jgi:hypothetical protein